MNQIKIYNIGLDIGTESVGWAVINPHTYKVLRRGKKKLWGVRLFGEGQTAEVRRGFRSNRRRYDRRKQRILYLQEIFAEEMEKIDNSFFIRLKDGFLYKEDKTINKNIKDSSKQFKYNLFIDKNFNDGDFYKAYPTIYHLRYELMNKQVDDLRLIYLAMHHIVKYRGNFLKEGKKVNATNIDIKGKLINIFKEIEENYDEIVTYRYEVNCEKIRDVLIDKKLRKLEKQKLIVEELKFFIQDKNSIKNIASLMVGLKSNLLDIFCCDAEDNEQLNKCKISFDSTDYEDNLSDLEEILDKNIELINLFKELYNDVYLSNLFKDSKVPTISYLMIDRYEKHKLDKKILKEIFNYKDKKDFFAKNGIYQKYVKEPKKYNYDVLSKELKKILNYYDETEVKNQILFDLENGNFLPKITDTSNGIYPYQLNLKELNKIIEIQGERFPFLKEKLEDGTYKIAKILTFRIPYYVGPLNRNINQKDSKAWLVKNNADKITPFNFDKVVNKIESANQFIKRMTSNCTYLYEEKAMPANSLLYSRFKILNELKQIKVNGKHICDDKELMNALLMDLFLRVPKVSDKIFKEYLIEVKYVNANDVIDITGYSAESGFANNLKAYIDFINIFDLDYVLNNEEVIENLIEWLTIFEDRKILKEKIKLKYPKFDNIIIDKICNLKYKGWSALSRKLLTGIYYIDNTTKERYNIIDLMENTRENFMQILFNKKYSFQDKINKFNFSSDINDITIEDIQNLATSPANKRGIWQAIKIVKELVQIMGNNPENIYIEMARGSNVKKRTNSRLKQLLELYTNCSADIDQYNKLYEEIQSCKKLDKDKYFLYYLQQGKCLYTGRTLSINDLDNCEIDHIIPRTLIKDDSLDNRALVLREENQKKGDKKTIPERILYSEIVNFWQKLRKNKFISEKKYNNLMRINFSEKDIEGFINRQLVETRQITKHVAGLLNNLYDSNKNVSSENTVVQFINANISHNYREKYKLYKYRQINNYHHAHDAYLTAVIGEYKKKLFENINIKDFVNDYKYKIKDDTTNNHYGVIIDNIENDIYDVNGEIVFEANKFKNVVCEHLYSQDILVTKKTEIYTGEFYNQTIYKKGVGKISLKNGLNPIKYGGYNSVNCSYMVLVKYFNKGKEKQKLIGIPIMYTIGKDIKNKINSYLKEELKCDEYVILKDKIPYLCLIKYCNQKCYVVGASEVINGIELKLSKENQIKYKYLLNFICNDKYPSYLNAPIDIQNNQNLQNVENNKLYWNKLFDKQIEEFIDVLLVNAKSTHPIFEKELIKIENAVKSGEFRNLELVSKEGISKKEVIIQILRMLKTDSGNANLKLFNKTEKFSDRVGRKNSITLSNGSIFNCSVTGIKEDIYEF